MPPARQRASISSSTFEGLRNTRLIHVSKTCIYIYSKRSIFMNAPMAKWAHSLVPFVPSILTLDF